MLTGKVNSMIYMDLTYFILMLLPTCPAVLLGLVFACSLPLVFVASLGRGTIRKFSVPDQVIYEVFICILKKSQDLMGKMWQ